VEFSFSFGDYGFTLILIEQTGVILGLCLHICYTFTAWLGLSSFEDVGKDDFKVIMVFILFCFVCDVLASLHIHPCLEVGVHQDWQKHLDTG
jgi:hypothetical protein